MKLSTCKYIVLGRKVMTTTLCSIIGNEEQMTAYELHIGVKDYCFGRDDRLIGVSVMQLKDIMDQVLIHLKDFCKGV